jgi:hypothetical protein
MSRQMMYAMLFWNNGIMFLVEVCVAVARMVGGSIYMLQSTLLLTLKVLGGCRLLLSSREVWQSRVQCSLL